LETEVLLPRLQ